MTAAGSLFSRPSSAAATTPQAAHLQGCTDKAAHRAFGKRKREEEAAAAVKAAKGDAQDAASSRAAFDFLGGRTQDVWRMNEAVRSHLLRFPWRRCEFVVPSHFVMLCDSTTSMRVCVCVWGQALRQMAGEYGLPTDGAHEKLVARIVRHRNALESSHLLTDGAEGSAPRGGKGGKLTRDSLPENLEMASEEVLRAVSSLRRAPSALSASFAECRQVCTLSVVCCDPRRPVSQTCAAHGLKPRGGKLASKKELIRTIEKELFKDHEDVLFLE